MKSFFKEFGEFIQRGNIMDMAVGVVIGTAFSAIVNSLVNDIIMPLVSLATGGIDFTNSFLTFNGEHYATLEAAKEAGASVFAYGSFIQAIVNFLIIALCIFITINAMKKAKEKIEKRLKKEEDKKDEKKSPEVVLLEQIKDLLKKQAK